MLAISKNDLYKFSGVIVASRVVDMVQTHWALAHGIGDMNPLEVTQGFGVLLLANILVVGAVIGLKLPCLEEVRCCAPIHLRLHRWSHARFCGQRLLEHRGLRRGTVMATWTADCRFSLSPFSCLRLFRSLR